MLEIRKDYLGIILFAMAIQDLCFKKVHNYARLIMEPLGNDYDIYGNLNVMITLFKDV